LAKRICRRNAAPTAAIAASAVPAAANEARTGAFYVGDGAEATASLAAGRMKRDSANVAFNGPEIRAGKVRRTSPTSISVPAAAAVRPSSTSTPSIAPLPTAIRWPMPRR